VMVASNSQSRTAIAGFDFEHSSGLLVTTGNASRFSRYNTIAAIYPVCKQERIDPGAIIPGCILSGCFCETSPGYVIILLSLTAMMPTKNQIKHS
ncbi:MAG: hypothetical protein P8Y73_09520, partial [Desulfuromonadales bacterium]